MALEGLLNRLIPEGTVLAGRKPKTILADDGSGGSQPGYFDTSQSGNLLRALQEFQVEAQIKEEKEMKKQKNRLDMYKTLRDSGYDPKRAYEAVDSNAVPNEPGGLLPKEEVAQAQLEKTKAQTENIKKRTSLITKSRSQYHAEIEQKVADGTATIKEQNIYDDVIKKVNGQSTGSGLQNILNKSTQDPTDMKNIINNAGSPDDPIPMIDPQGRAGTIPRKNVEKAKARGWKLR